MPGDVIRRREDEIYEVMGELAGIVVEEDVSSWTHSRKTCLKLACHDFYFSTLLDMKLRPTLTQLVHTWDPEWPF